MMPAAATAARLAITHIIVPSLPASAYCLGSSPFYPNFPSDSLMMVDICFFIGSS